MSSEKTVKDFHQGDRVIFSCRGYVILCPSRNPDRNRHQSPDVAR
jgi:hypothetical protein